MLTIKWSALHRPAALSPELRASPWPDVPQICRELLDSTSICSDELAIAPYMADQYSGDLSPLSSGMGGLSYSALNSPGVSHYGGVDLSGGYAHVMAQGGAGHGGVVVPDDKARLLAEQLAQLHEESRRLQEQSQALQQRALEMSMQVGCQPTNAAGHM